MAAKLDWRGVFPAVTTQFREDESLDLDATAGHVDWLIRSGVHGLIMLGTVGENSTLDAAEKRAVLKLALEAAGGRVPVIAGVAEDRTRLACTYAEDAARLGVDALMVLPGMVYRSDRGETLGHFRAVARASGLPVMCYNNPVSYGVDITPEMLRDLADEPTIVAVKESSDDVRRITDIKNACGDRYTLLCGVDDLILESMLLGAVGWVAGLVNAFPLESVTLWRLASEGRYAEALPLYRWFMPLLHLDTKPKLVQYIKLAQATVGHGSETVRRPRSVIAGEERRAIEKVIRDALAARPALG
jgi:dihydrodipicolinate synthase/N-acetylneuraminate lyase